MRFKNGVFGLICMLGISAPMIIQWGDFMTVKGLEGSINADTTKLSFSWWSSDLQKRLENEATDSLLLFPACVRTRNQFEYSVFDKLNAQDIYESDGIFYRYVRPDYNERDEFLGEQKIAEHVAKLLLIQKQLNKPIYVVITPNKMRFYPESLPEINQIHSDSNNYSWYKKLLHEAGIKVLDSHEWHYRNKKKHTIPIMSKQGVHWTLYGAAITMDSLVRRISKDMHVDYQRVTMEIGRGDEIYAPDIDLAVLSNLVFCPADKRLKNVYFPLREKMKPRLKPVIIGDSFFNAIQWTAMHQQLFEPETPFYYYFNTRFTMTPFSEMARDWKVVSSDIDKSECIIILTDIQNMSQFGFGFIENFPLEKARH